RLKKDASKEQEKAHQALNILSESVQSALEDITKRTKLSLLIAGLQKNHQGREVQALLQESSIHWHRLDETDVHALRAWARILLSRQEAGWEDAERLCSHILQEFYPEDFDSNLTRLQ